MIWPPVLPKDGLAAARECDPASGFAPRFFLDKSRWVLGILKEIKIRKINTKILDLFDHL